MARSNWNPLGHPSPKELGFKKGMHVLHVHNGVGYPGKVVRVYPSSIVVVDDNNGLHIQCHPHGQFVRIDAEGNLLP